MRKDSEMVTIIIKMDKEYNKLFKLATLYNGSSLSVLHFLARDHNFFPGYATICASFMLTAANFVK